MKFKLKYKRWKRIKKQLKYQGMVRLKDKFVYPNITYHNYTLPVLPPGWYPRVHLITTDGGYCRIVEVHVDIVPHKHTEYFHPAVDMVTRIINNTR